MAWHQTEITLRARPRGFHLVTDEIVAHISRDHVGARHVIATVRGDGA